jgi:hypothetical protein
MCRLWRTLVLLDQAHIDVIRVTAWDGTGDVPAASAAEMFHRNFGGADGTGLHTSTAPDGVPALKKRDEYSDIPERDVSLTWDSTLNAKFDLRCAPNTSVIATPSERACAASHLKVWRSIAEICGLKVPGRGASKLLQLQSSDSSLSGGGDSTYSPADIYRAAKGDITSTRAEPASNHNDALQKPFADSSGGEYFIIFEDDVSFPQQSLADLRATIRSLMAALPADVDMLYLGGLMPKAAPDFKLQHKKGDPFYGVNYMWTLQAYVLRRRAVEVLLSKLPMWAPVDNFVASLIFNKELKVTPFFNPGFWYALVHWQYCCCGRLALRRIN